MLLDPVLGAPSLVPVLRVNLLDGMLSCTNAVPRQCGGGFQTVEDPEGLSLCRWEESGVLGHVPGLGNDEDEEEDSTLEAIYIGIVMLLGMKGKSRCLEMEDITGCVAYVSYLISSSCSYLSLSSVTHHFGVCHPP